MSNKRYTIVVIATLLLPVSILHAQRIQGSAISGGIPGAPGVGVNFKYGTSNEVWDINLALNISRVKEKIEQEFGPHDFNGTKTYTAFFPYAEVSAYKIIAMGIAPYSPRSDGGSYGPLAVVTLSYPIKIYNRIDIVPSLQLLFAVGTWLPGGFLAAGVAITL